MSKPYPLAGEIKKFVDNPDAWQWQEILYSGWPAVVTESYHNVSFVEAMGIHRRGGQVRLIPKRNLIPSDRLPEGWEVERLACGDYKVNSPHCKIAVYCRAGMDIYDLLRHIDPEASDD